MVRRKVRKLDAPGVEESVGADKERVSALARKRGERRIDLAAAAGVEDMQLHTHGAHSRLQVVAHGFGANGITWIDERGHTRGAGHQLMQQREPFGDHLGAEKIYPGRIASGAGDARNETKLDRILTDAEDDRDRRGSGLSRACAGRAARHRDHRHPTTDQIGRQFLHPIVLTLRPAILDRDVLTFHKARFVEPLPERRQEGPEVLKRTETEEPDHRHRRLLRSRGERPRRRAAEQRDELAAPHSITSSASESKLSEIVTPSAFAVFKLITNWNLTVSITGRSAGLTPLSTRPVYTPTRRYASEASTP